MQMNKMISEEEVGSTSRNQKWQKEQKRKEGQMINRRKKICRDQPIRVMILIYKLYKEAALKEKPTEPLGILKINNKKVKEKLDTGAEVNVMLMRVFKQIEDGHVKTKKTKTKTILCGENRFQDSTHLGMI